MRRFEDTGAIVAGSTRSIRGDDSEERREIIQFLMAFPD